jgi:uncharacterized protein (DUF2062 family)
MIDVLIMICCWSITHMFVFVVTWDYRKIFLKENPNQVSKKQHIQLNVWFNAMLQGFSLPNPVMDTRINWFCQLAWPFEDDLCFAKYSLKNHLQALLHSLSSVHLSYSCNIHIYTIYLYIVYIVVELFSFQVVWRRRRRWRWRRRRRRRWRRRRTRHFAVSYGLLMQ